MLRFSDCITEVKANSLIKFLPFIQMALLKAKPFTAYYENIIIRSRGGSRIFGRGVPKTIGLRIRGKTSGLSQ